MLKRFKRIVRKTINNNRRIMSHGDLIEQLLEQRLAEFPENPVFVESGGGVSTLSLAKTGKALNAKVYSLDYNADKVDDLKSRSGELVSNVEYMIDDSLKSLAKIVERHAQIDFLFLDSAASAMHTFREFQIAEPILKPGACLLVDNAALPQEKHLLSPVRKGKILVPYLLASPYWEVTAHPGAGDSMISAVMRETADFADPLYEDPEYIDSWKTFFDSKIDSK